MTRPLRILRVITRLNVGGPATHVTVADRGLIGRGWDTLLAFGTVEPDEAEVDVAALGVPHVRVPSLIRSVLPASDLRAALAIARLIRRHRPDVIHSHLSKAGLIARATAIATSGALRVHTFHGTVFGGYFGERTSGAILRAERWLGARSHAVVALSPRQRQELLDYRIAPASAIHVVPLGLPLDRFAPAAASGARDAARRRLGLPADAFLVTAIGRLVPIKRLDRLVDAFAETVDAIPNGRLVLVGGGSERAALETRIADAGLSQRAILAGWSMETPDWYAAADVIALTSDREGTPLALIEAAASGRPTVAADVGGVADVVADGVTGFLVPADDTAAFADRLIRLAGNPGLRSSMGAAAPTHAAGFADHRLVDDLDALYRSLLSARSRPA